MENELDENLPPALLMITIAFLLHIIGNATTYYITIEYPDYITNSGLWKRCVSIANDKVCYNEKLYAEYDWYRICLAMSAFGFIALLASIACVGLRLFKFPENKGLRITAILVTFSAVVFILIGTVLFVKNVDDITTGGEFVYGYSFALCISGMCLAALVDILLVIGLIKPKKNRVDANSINNINF
ncbi:uncharacterized protein LOC127723976 [Mytilus californianus]|uniref:uncharacterized protein LOC127723976 n=1 Tax=Mytilus californianus TaxID=6549 RepID=UPI00224659A6|nr:uncharacterized protein LOC127723976 [Mytilus californianus]